MRRLGHRAKTVRAKGLRPSIDHVHPKSKGGHNKIENLLACCYHCNNKKGDKFYMEEWMPDKDLV
jgi:5-methylcytosine-specific restriction endonuclease McrA